LWSTVAAIFVLTLLAGRSVSAAVIPVTTAVFGPGSTLTTFAGLADGTEVNGLVVGGLTFQYSLGNGVVVIDGGPGTTNNVAPPNIVSIGNPGGILTILLPSLVDTFGYGFAILATAPVATATTISLFNGATPVGSLSFAGSPDPVFTGGFAGIQSTLPFNRVEATFNAVAAPAFAVDNIRTARLVTVPEPATILLFGIGVGALARRRRHSR
jgi:hypothetical protein